MTSPPRGKRTAATKPSSNPNYESFSPTGFILDISETQLRKSTINANKIVRSALSSIIDYSKITPGEKVVLPCLLKINGKETMTKASFLIPKRRGETSPEPRMWPYHLNSHVEPGSRLWFYINNGQLEVCDSEPR
jgi:hypothetical protein